MTTRIKILYIDNEPYNLNAFKAHFRTKDEYEVSTSTSDQDGIELLSNTEFHIVLVNQRRKEGDIINFLNTIGEHDPNALRVVVTGYGDTNIIDKTVCEDRIFGYHTKPWDLNEVERTIKSAYKIYKLKNIKSEL